MFLNSTTCRNSAAFVYILRGFWVPACSKQCWRCSPQIPRELNQPPSAPSVSIIPGTSSRLFSAKVTSSRANSALRFHQSSCNKNVVYIVIGK